jgi:hypothetical protein
MEIEIEGSVDDEEEEPRSECDNETRAQILRTHICRVPVR